MVASKRPSPNDPDFFELYSILFFLHLILSRRILLCFTKRNALLPRKQLMQLTERSFMLKLNNKLTGGIRWVYGRILTYIYCYTTALFWLGVRDSKQSTGPQLPEWGRTKRRPAKRALQELKSTTRISDLAIKILISNILFDFFS